MALPPFRAPPKAACTVSISCQLATPAGALAPNPIAVLTADEEEPRVLGVTEVSCTVDGAASASRRRKPRRLHPSAPAARA